MRYRDGGCHRVCGECVGIRIEEESDDTNAFGQRFDYLQGKAEFKSYHVAMVMQGILPHSPGDAGNPTCGPGRKPRT